MMEGKTDRSVTLRRAVIISFLCLAGLGTLAAATTALRVGHLIDSKTFRRSVA